MPISEFTNDLLSFIRLERDRRFSVLLDYPEDERADQWLTVDQPLINDLALMLIVTIRHDFERQLVLLAAKITGDCQPIPSSEYLERVKQERRRVRESPNGLNVLIDKLPLHSCPEWNGSMDLLRLLANCYKHDPWMVPDDQLRTRLGLPKGHYAGLPESNALRKAIVKFMKLSPSADYSDIAEWMIEHADVCLKHVSENVTVSKVIWQRRRLADGGE